MSVPDHTGSYAAVGARLKASHAAAGVSQERLSERLGVSNQRLQKYERGENRLPLHRMVAAAAAVGVSVLDLLPAETQTPEPQAVEDGDALRIAEACADCAPVVRRAVLALCLALRRPSGAGVPPRDWSAGRTLP